MLTAKDSHLITEIFALLLEFLLVALRFVVVVIAVERINWTTERVMIWRSIITNGMGWNGMR